MSNVHTVEVLREGRVVVCHRLGWFDVCLHAPQEATYQVECALLLYVVVQQCASIGQLFSGEDQALLIK